MCGKLLFSRYIQKSSRLIKLQNSFKGNILRSNLCVILTFCTELDI